MGKEWMTGHINIGKRITVYGRNAMHWGVTIRTKKYGYICFRLPFTCERRWYPLYLYFSPNATPWASTFFIGKNHSRGQKKLSKLRKQSFGHNFSVDGNYSELQKINDLI